MCLASRRDQYFQQNIVLASQLCAELLFRSFNAAIHKHENSRLILVDCCASYHLETILATVLLHNIIETVFVVRQCLFSTAKLCM